MTCAAAPAGRAGRAPDTIISSSHGYIQKRCTHSNQNRAVFFFPPCTRPCLSAETREGPVYPAGTGTAPECRSLLQASAGRLSKKNHMIPMATSLQAHENRGAIFMLKEMSEGAFSYRSLTRGTSGRQRPPHSRSCSGASCS